VTPTFQSHMSLRGATLPNANRSCQKATLRTTSTAAAQLHPLDEQIASVPLFRKGP
jgi:hypothetical protein